MPLYNPTLLASIGDLNQTSFSIANNQAVAANITGFLFSATTCRSFTAFVSAFIDATSDLSEAFTLRGEYNGASWDLSQTSNGSASLITFTITNAGQVQYTSGNYSGFSSGTIKFRALVTNQ